MICEYWRSLFTVFDIIDVLETDCRKALDSLLDDYEDALVAVCGNKANVDYIITRDEDFLNLPNSPATVISPTDFLQSQK